MHYFNHRSKGMNVAVMYGFAMTMLMFVVVGIVMSIGGGVQQSVASTQCLDGQVNATTGACLAGNTTLAYNISIQSMQGTANAATNMPLIGTIIGLTVIVSFLLGIFITKKAGAGDGV